MGFKGIYFVYRSLHPFAQLVGSELGYFDPEVCAGRWHGDWQVWKLFGWPEDFPPDLLLRLRDASGAPVLAGEVWDDSAIQVKGLGLLTPPWQVWLKVRGVLGYMLTPPSPFDEHGNFLGENWSDPEYQREVEQLRRRLLATAPGGPKGAHNAVRWSNEAGLTAASPPEIAEIIDREEGFSQDIFAELLAGLGVGSIG
jgi:hypothetical protein